VFDIGFWEIAIVGVIALLVIGPERLPSVAQQAGMWVGRVRRYVSHVKQDIEREINADEMRKLLENPEGLEDIRDVARETASVLDDTRKELKSVANDVQVNTTENEATHEPSPAEPSDPSAGPADITSSDEPSDDEQRPEQSGQR
jgi:sec-independent protein translocase protein TatB